GRARGSGAGSEEDKKEPVYRRAVGPGSFPGAAARAGPTTGALPPQAAGTRRTGRQGTARLRLRVSASRQTFRGEGSRTPEGEAGGGGGSGRRRTHTGPRPPGGNSRDDLVWGGATGGMRRKLLFSRGCRRVRRREGGVVFSQGQSFSRFLRLGPWSQ